MLFRSSAAVAAARDEHAENDAVERAALVQAEADALTDLAVATSQAETARAETTQLRRELADLTTRLEAAEAARDQQAALAAAATKEATDARAATHTAELLAAEAQATARTLREILDTVSKGAKSNQAKS